MLLVGQRRRVGERFGDARVDRLEHRQNPVTHQVAVVVDRLVALVAPVDDAELAAVGAQLGRPQAEQRSREAVLARPHGAQRRRRGVLDETVEHGLGLVVAVVGGDHDVGLTTRRDRARGVVADASGTLLKPRAGRLARKAHDVQRHGERATRVLDDAPVARRGRAPRGVVDVQARQLEPEAEPSVDRAHDVEQGHRVGAARQHQERPLTGPQEGAGRHVVGRTPAQRRRETAAGRPIACRVHRRRREV